MKKTWLVLIIGIFVFTLAFIGSYFSVHNNTIINNSGRETVQESTDNSAQNRGNFINYLTSPDLAEEKVYSYTVSKEVVGYSVTGYTVSAGITYTLSPIDEEGAIVTENIAIQHYINAIDEDRRIVSGEDISYEDCIIEFSGFTDEVPLYSGIGLNFGAYSIDGELWFSGYAGITIGEAAAVEIGEAASLYDKQIDGTRVIISSYGDLIIADKVTIGTGINYITSKIMINSGTLTINGMPTIISKMILMSTDSYLELGNDFSPVNIAKNQGTAYAGKLNIFYDTTTFSAGNLYSRILRGYVDTSKIQAFVASGTALSSRFTVNSAITTDLDFEIAYKYVFYSDEGDGGVVRSESNVYLGQVIAIPVSGLITKTGYNLVGWFLNPAYPATQINGITTTASGSNTTVRVNPLWVPAQYFINYHNMFGAEHEIGYPIKYTYTQSTVLKDAEKPGYTFAGWYSTDGTVNGNWGEEVTILSAETYASNINLYARWKVRLIESATDETDTLVSGSIINLEGFEQGLTLIINKINSSEFITDIPNKYKVSQLFNAQLLNLSEQEVPISNEVSLKIAIPTGLDLETLKVLAYENGEVVEKEYTVSDGCIVFKISTLSDFAFITEKNNNLGWLSLLIIAIMLGSTVGLYIICHSTSKKPEVQIIVPLKDVPVATFNTLAQRVGKIHYYVLYKNNVWVVKRDNDNRQYVITDNKAVAIKYARLYCIREQAELRIHGKDGTLQDTNNYGSDLKDKK